MITNVAAFLIATAAITGVPGAFVVPGIDHAAHPAVTGLPAPTDQHAVWASDAVNIASSPDRPPLSSRVTPSSRAPLARSLTGRALLDGLADLPASAISRFVSENPRAVSKLQGDQPSAASVANWWRLESADARANFLAGAPAIAGNLDGLPVELRDRANRVELSDTIRSLTSSMGGLGRAEQSEAAQRLHMLHQIEKSLHNKAGQPERQLLSIDTAWPGRAAVVVGDLAAADYVTYMVPGMFFTVDNQMVDWTVISQDLYDEETGWMKRLAPDDATLASASVAVVSWIGYETPGILDVASLDLAKQGAKYISSSVRGVRASRAGTDPFITLVTHSYGSTATMMALHDGTVTADSLVIVGSPGGPARSVADIGMPADRVFVGEAAWDPVVNMAFFGSDPGSESFGATAMDVGGGTDPITGNALAPAIGHLGYFDKGTTAMRNMALVGLNRGDLVAHQEPTGSRFVQADGR